jgi:hypothetical protein
MAPMAAPQTVYYCTGTIFFDAFSAFLGQKIATSTKIVQFMGGCQPVTSHLNLWS